MASRNAQKHRTRERKARQGKAWTLYKAAARRTIPALFEPHDLQFSQLRQKTKQTVVELYNAVRK